MNPTVISVTALPDKDDFRRVLLWYQRKRAWLLMLLPTGMLLGMGVILSESLSGAKIIGIRIEFLAAALITFLLIFGVSRIAPNRQARKLERVSVQTNLRFDDRGVTPKTDSAEAFTIWKGIVKVIEIEHDFVVFPQDNIFYIMPKRFFESLSDINALKDLLSRELGDRAKLIEL